MPLRPLVVCVVRHHTILKLTYHVGKSIGVGKFLHDLPQFFAIHRVEGLRHIHEDCVDGSPHLLTLTLQLVCGEDHVGGTVMAPENALTFREESLFQLATEAIEVDAGENLPDGAEQRDSSVVVAELAVSLLLVAIDNGGVLESVWYLSLATHHLEEHSELVHQLGAAMHVNLNSDRV
uniref:Uncharacterized protein n=1 Tax=Schistocephalus solidus TaxID=70667 RepID=A0A0X3PIP9_SCHSO